MDTLAIIDWDNTLFPTSWYIFNKIQLKRNNIFDELDTHIVNFLSSLNCIIFIVTNAMMKWIDSSLLVLPKTAAFINKKIPIISAKESYSSITNNQYEWKKYAFKDIIKKVNNLKHVISIGDAEYEYNALVELQKHTTNVYLKTIRLIQNPDIRIVLDQLKVLMQSVNQYKNNNRHLDLVFHDKK